MLILGLVGSPRKDGRSNALVDAALRGAVDAGADTAKHYLIDYEIEPHTGQVGESCCPEPLNRSCEEADALVLAAPVYYGDINGLTKDFMDSVRIANSNGKLALGAAIAGGSGKGLLSGIQSIYHFFYHRQMRAVDPTPASRFNMEAALESFRESGSKLVTMAGSAQPFAGARRDDRWADVLAYYADMPYMEAGPVDEFAMLVEQLLAISEGEAADRARAERDRALALLRQGERAQGARLLVGIYEALYF